MAIWLHYEDLRPTLDAVQFLFSSSKNNKNVHWKTDGEELNNLVIVIKQIPSNFRTYDQQTHIWTLSADKFDAFKQMFFPTTRYSLHADLQAWVSSDNKWYTKNTNIPKPEDFFYQQQAAPAQALDKFTVQKRLAELIGLKSNGTIEITRKDYLLACKRLHPDMGGSAEKMSELNSLWSVYKELV